MQKSIKHQTGKRPLITNFNKSFTPCTKSK